LPGARQDTEEASQNLYAGIHAHFRTKSKPLAADKLASTKLARQFFRLRFLYLAAHPLPVHSKALEAQGISYIHAKHPAASMKQPNALIDENRRCRARHARRIRPEAMTRYEKRFKH